jgi:hypothetical protein
MALKKNTNEDSFEDKPIHLVLDWWCGSSGRVPT